MRTAFGLEYLVPRRPTVSIDEPYGAPSRESARDQRNGRGVDVPDACLQRLSVFIQLKRQHDESLEQEVTITPTIINSSYTLENTAIVFDSMHSEVSTHELMAGKKSWHQLLQDFDLADPPPGSSIAFTAIQLIFEAIADK